MGEEKTEAKPEAEKKPAAAPAPEAKKEEVPAKEAVPAAEAAPAPEAKKEEEPAPPRELKKADPKVMEELESELSEKAIVALKGVINGAAADLKKFGKDIAKDLILAVRAGDEEWKAELLVNVRQLTVIHKLGMSEAGWAFAENAIGVIIKAARTALALKGISI